jgi:hypothetical protein
MLTQPIFPPFLQTNDTLFRVHGYFFSRESSFFNKKLNPASPGDVREGTNDNDPVVLKDVSSDEFAKLLWVFYNPCVLISFSVCLLRLISTQKILAIRSQCR